MCREAIVAASHCDTVNVVEFHLGPAASSNTLVQCDFVLYVLVWVWFYFLEVDLQCCVMYIIIMCFGIPSW